MKDFCIILILVLLVAQVSSLALNRQHDAACTTCPSGYSLSSGRCRQNCPGGWADLGTSCQQKHYSRGLGYPLQFGDPINNSEALRKCEAANGPGNCERWQNTFYPKCKPGFTAGGCCICLAASNPDCNAFGFNGGLGSSCTKKVITC